MPVTRHVRRNFGAEMGERGYNGIRPRVIILFIFTNLSNRLGSRSDLPTESPSDAND